MSEKTWDFSGWATKAGIRCSDGRTIRKGAFKDCAGKTVPLVWNHRHDDVSEVLGHALLEDRDGDMYTYCYFNNTENGKYAKELVQHGDVVSLSIYANSLQQTSKKPPCDVIHGVIREVSLVLAGANPGAFIDNVSFAHGDSGETIEEAIIYNPDDVFEFSHAEDEAEPEVVEATEEVSEEVSEEPTEEPVEGNDEMDSIAQAAIDLVHMDAEPALAHAADDDKEEEKGKTVQDFLDTLSDEQKDYVYGLVGLALKGHDTNDNDKEEEDSNMKHNVFDADTVQNEDSVLLHSEDYNKIFENARRGGSLKGAVEDFINDNELAHTVTDRNGNTVTYGIADIDYLFPDAKNYTTQPQFITGNIDWVKKVMNGTHHTPFSRVKTQFADITMDEARARGYIKGNQKADEVFALLQRDTAPQTIYKKQKLDRDDIIDITDFDVVAWIKGEMRMKLEEEIARAILIGDGRQAGNDKIKETNVRPIFNDADLFTIKYAVEIPANATESEKAEALMEAVLKARKRFKGTGTPSFFTTEDELSGMLLMKDGVGHRFYKTEAEVATALRAAEVVPVEPMEGQKIGITVGQVTTQYDLAGVLVNLTDYNIGADKGGQTQLFDDFDINYNQYAYLLETRISGALVKPYSAISFYYKEQA